MCYMHTQICVGFRVNFAAVVTQRIQLRQYGAVAWGTLAVTYIVMQGRNTL
jgi:hypothetical protein